MEFFEFSNRPTTAWTDIYKPKKIDEIVGNKRAINSIISWLGQFETTKKKIMTDKKTSKSLRKKKVIIDEDIETDNNSLESKKMDESSEDRYVKPSKDNYSSLLISGSHGIGKTSAVFTILHELGYAIQLLNFNKIKTVDHIKDVMDMMGNDYNIISLVNESKIKQVLVVDEIDSLTSKIEKACIATLIKNNDMFWIQPIIFISNNKHSKLLTEIKKNSLEIKMWQPYPNEINLLLRRICDNSGIKILNPHVTNKIIEHCQKDLRRLVFILQDLYNIVIGNKNMIVTKEIIDEYCISCKEKDMDFDLYRISGKLINGYNGLEDSLLYYEADKVVIPLMIQQNYVKNINLYSEDETKNPEIARKISEFLSKGDVIENYIYGNQNWDLQEVHGFYSVAGPSFYLDKYLMDDRTEKLDYPKDLNKTSIMMINKGTIEKAKKGLKNMDIHDYIYLNEIVKTLLSKDKIKECMELFEGYDLKIENIESLIKVEKIKNTKTNLTSKQKKEMMNYLSK